jgi:hypothetical protein
MLGEAEKEMGAAKRRRPSIGDCSSDNIGTAARIIRCIGVQPTKDLAFSRAIPLKWDSVFATD